MARIAWWQAARQFLNSGRRVRRLQRRVQLYRPWFEILERRLPPTVTLSVSDPAPFPKPDSGQLMGMFVVTRSGDLAPAVQVDYHTQDGNGANGAHAGIDYLMTAGTLNFAPNQMTATIAVPVLGNNLFQENKTFTVSLSNPLPSAAFASQQSFPTGTRPYSVAVGDFNGDGKPDLAVSSNFQVSVLLNTAGPGATVPSFAPQQTFAAGLSTFVTVGDFNGDGKPDLAVAPAANNTVSVLLNTTPRGATIPSFAPLKTFATGSEPAGVAVGDFNGDGKPDLAVANSNSNMVSVLLNTTGPGATIPSFAPQQTFITGNNPLKVAVGDFNGDGKPDLAVANALENTVAVLLDTTPLGATTPTFTSPIRFLTGEVPDSVAVGDFNGDGQPDLAIANRSSNTVSVLLNTTPAQATAPSFARQQTFGVGFAPASVAVGDFNGDGQPDLALVNFGSGTVSVLLNSTPVGATTSRFTPQQSFATGAFPKSVAVGDFNSDGKPDLAIVNSGSDTVSVLLNARVAITAAPSFAPSQTFTVGGLPRSVAVGDFNGDGKPDLVVADKRGMVSVLLNTTPPGATIPSFNPLNFAENAAPYRVAVGDFNGDGKPDLVFADVQGTAVSVLLNTTPQGATFASFAPPQTFTAGFPVDVAVGDFNGDGKPDLAVANVFSNAVSVLLNMTPPGATTASFAPQQTFGIGFAPASVAVGDFNEDGKPDLAVSNRNSAGGVVVLLNTTPLGVTSASFAPRQDFAVGSGITAVVVGDFNSDGKPDLAVANRGSNTVSVLLNTTLARATTPHFAPQQTFATDFAPEAVAVGDFNGDGFPDLALANYGSATVSVLVNTTPVGALTPRFASQRTFAAGGFPDSVAVGDFNGDGKPDLAIADYLSSTVTVLLNTRVPITVPPSFAPQQTFATDVQPVSVSVGDLNGDGQPDLAIINRYSNTVSVLLNTKAGGATALSFAPQQTFATGSDPIAVAVGDFNGDGQPDLVIANALSNTVSVLLNTTAMGATIPSFAPQQTFPTGHFPDSVAVGDFNGDGKPDLAIANYLSGIVSVLLNTTAAGATVPSFTSQQTFPTGHFPSSVAVGDFNGDGKTDLAITNVLSNTVSVLLNTTAAGATAPSFAAQQTFATGSEPVSVVVGDFNGDGQPDLAVANYDDSPRSFAISVLLNTTPPEATTPSFAPQQTFAVGNEPRSVAIGDFTGDGKPDLAVTNFGDDTVSVLLNTTAVGATIPSFATQQTFPTGCGPFSTVVGDFDGDGKPDLAVANYDANTVSVLLNNTASLTLSGSPATGTISSAEEAPTTIVAVAGTTPQSTVVDTAFAVPLAVEVRDAAGHLVQGVRVTFTAPRHGPSGSFDGDTSVTVVTDANGRATAPSFVANTVAGSYLVRAHAAGGSRPSTDFSLTNTPASAVTFQVLTPGSVTSGTPFDVTVIAVDPYGNTDINYTGTVHFSSSDGDPGVVLPDDYTFQPGDAGQVTFAGGVTLLTPGDQVLTVTDVDSGVTGSDTVTVTDDNGSGRPLNQSMPHRRLDSRTWNVVVEAAGFTHRRLVIGPFDVAWVDDLTWSLGE